MEDSDPIEEIEGEFALPTEEEWLLDQVEDESIVLFS
jgi:hypothetical protein